MSNRPVLPLTDETHGDEDEEVHQGVAASESAEVDETGVGEVARVAAVHAHANVEGVAGQDRAKKLKRELCR